MNSQEKLNFYLHTEQFQKTLMNNFNFSETLSALLSMNALTLANKEEIENQFRYKSRMDATNFLIAILSKQTFTDLFEIINKFNENDDSLKENIKDVQTGWSNLLNNLKEFWRYKTASLNLLPYGIIKEIDINNTTNSLQLIFNKTEYNMENINYLNFHTIFEIFWDNILILGENSIGKTTHINYLLNLWSNNLWLNNNEKLLLFINLENVSINNDLFDAILKQNFHDNVYINRKILKYIFQARYFDIILYIDNVNKLSFIDHLYKTLKNDKYFIKTIIWSQNYDIQLKKKDYFDSIFEIIGFNIEQIQEFLIKYYNVDDDNFKEFLLDIKKYELTSKMCKVPSLLLLLYLVWKEIKGFSNTNLYDIYENILNYIQYKSGYPKDYFYKNMQIIYSISFNYVNQHNTVINIEKDDKKDLITILKYFSHITKPNMESKNLNIQFFHSSIKSFFACKYLISNYCLKNKLNFEKVGLENHLNKVNNLELYIFIQFIKQNSIDLFNELLFISRKIQEINESDNEFNDFMLKGMNDNKNLFIKNKNLNNTIITIIFENIGQNIVTIHLENLFIDFQCLVNSLSKCSKNLKEFEIFFNKFHKRYTFSIQLWYEILKLIVSTQLKSFIIKNILQSNNADQPYYGNDANDSVMKVPIDEEIFENIKENSIIHLENFCLSGCCLSEFQSSLFGQLLCHCKNITSGDLSYSLVKDSGFKNIIHGLKNSSERLKILNFYKFNINGKQAVDLGEMLFNCSNLESLNLGWNDQLQTGLIAICDALKNSVSCLKILNFKWCDLLNEQSETIMEILPLCTTLKSFDISWNKNIYLKFKNVIESLSASSSSLEYLNFSNCNLTEIEGKAIGELLKNCSNIQFIDISGNRNLYGGLNQILNGLKTSSAVLSKINISGCNMTNNQAIIIGEFLNDCSNISSLNISWNQKIDFGFNKIIEGLKNSTKHIEYLNFCGCNLNESQATTLSTLINNCECIICLDISFSKYMNQGLLLIIEALHSSVKTLRTVFLKNCRLNKIQLKALEKLQVACPYQTTNTKKMFSN